MHTLTVHRLGGAGGALVRGFTEESLCTPEFTKEILAHLTEYDLLICQPDGEISDSGMFRFARQLGPLTSAHPSLRLPDPEEISHHLLPIDSQYSKADAWHTDGSFNDYVPFIALLRADILPSYGGETAWAFTRHAYSSLSAEFRSVVDQLSAIHDNNVAGIEPPADGDPELIARYETFLENRLEAEHPVVTVDPLSGDPAILLGAFAKSINGFDEGESRALIDLVQQRVTSNENTVRWRWKAGEFALWNNRTTQHYGVNDYGQQHRRMTRFSIAGEPPVGVDGRASRLLRGNSSGFHTTSLTRSA